MILTPTRELAIQIAENFKSYGEKIRLRYTPVFGGDAGTERSLVFTRTKHGAGKMGKQLEGTGVHAAAIHGNKSQNARQKALSDFRQERVKVLIATDIAARGIDIDHLPREVNFNIPEAAETYVHCIGRTGRGAAATGKAISFFDYKEAGYLKSIQKLIGFPVPVLKVPAHLR